MLQIATTAAPIRNRRKRLDDASFINALGFDFRNAATIARLMVASGTPASLQTIRQRMAQYVRETRAVEAKGACWRLAVANDDNSPPPVATAQAKGKTLCAAIAGKVQEPFANDTPPRAGDQPSSRLRIGAYAGHPGRIDRSGAL